MNVHDRVPPVHRSAGGVPLSNQIWLIYLLRGRQVVTSKSCHVIGLMCSWCGNGGPGWLEHSSLGMCPSTALWWRDMSSQSQTDGNLLTRVTYLFDIKWYQWTWMICLCCCVVYQKIKTVMNSGANGGKRYCVIRVLRRSRTHWLKLLFHILEVATSGVQSLKPPTPSTAMCCLQQQRVNVGIVKIQNLCNFNCYGCQALHRWLSVVMPSEIREMLIVGNMALSRDINDHCQSDHFSSLSVIVLGACKSVLHHCSSV